MVLDIDEVRHRMEKFNWVKEVTVRKVYPDKLHIRVVEREPVGIARLDKLWLFDANGVFLDEYRPSEHGLDWPVLSGLQQDAGNPQAGEENLERIRRYLEFLQEIDAGRARIPSSFPRSTSRTPPTWWSSPWKGCPGYSWVTKSWAPGCRNTSRSSSGR